MSFQKLSSLFFLTLLLLLLLVVSIFVSSSSASRLLDDSLHLPANPQSHKSNILLLPSTSIGNIHSGHVTVLVRHPAARKYGPLILAKLPKGSVTPSGPSQRTNDINN